MSIITISRGSHSMGKAVAEAVAERLGYECLSRDVLLEASDRYNVPEIKLQHAIGDAPSIWERFSHGARRAYVAYIQSALTQHVRKDNVVYHGLAGHLLLQNVGHVFKVRILSPMAHRVQIVKERERCTQREAEAYIAKLDSHRRKWTQNLYQVDPWDPSLYDLMLSIPRFSVETASALICQSVEEEPFETTDASRREMTDLALACQVKAALVERYPEVAVGCRFGNVLVYCSERHERAVKAAIDEVAPKIEGLENIEVHAGVSPPESVV